MEPLKLDEALKFKWIIKYSVLSENDLITLAEGPVFDFIPNEGDNIRINGETYKVIMRTIDFDHSIIWISLFDKFDKNTKY